MRWGLRNKIVAWVFIPTAVMMFSVAWLIFGSYKQVTENLIVERNRALTALVAADLSTELAAYTDILAAHAAPLADGRLDAVNSDNLTALLWQVRNHLEPFDGGVLILNNRGDVVGASADRLENIGENWSDRAYFRQMLQMPTVIFSDVVTDGVDGMPVVAVVSPISGDQGQFLGVLVGFLRLDGALQSSLYRSIVKLDNESSGAVYLTDENGRFIYESRTEYDNGEFTPQSVAQRALDGESGAVHTRTIHGEDVIASYAPVSAASWALVIEEDWEKLVATNRAYGTYFSILLAASMILPAIIAAISVRQITKPVHELTTAVSAVAQGNFGQTIQVNTGDEIEVLATQFNLMSHKLAESYGHLEQRLAEQEKAEAALRAYQENLATLVETRTAELTDANSHLAQEIEERRRTEANLEMTLARTDALYRASRALMNIESLSQLLQTAVDNVVMALSADHAVLYMVDTEAKKVTRTVNGGQGAEQITAVSFDEWLQGMGGWILQNSEPILSPQGETDPHESAFVQQQRAASNGGDIIVAPLRYGRRTWGVLTVTNKLEDRRFSQEDVEFTAALAGQVAAAIENAHLYAEAERRAINLSTLYAVGQEIVSTLNLEKTLQIIVDDVVKVARARKSLILLIDSQKEELTQVFGYGYTQEQIDAITYAEIQSGVSGWAMRNRQPTLSDHMQTDPRNKTAVSSEARKHGNGPAIVAPLIIKDEVIGTLVALNNSGESRFTDADLDLVTLLAAQAANAIQNAYLYEAAQEADRIKSAFLASMSHELRTPLNSIIGFTGIILKGLTGPLNAEQSKQLNMVRNSARHLLSLINDVLDISKIEAGQLSVELAPFDIRRAIMTAIHTVMPLAQKKDLPLIMDIATDVGELVSDQQRVEQILINLINNAVKFTDEGEVRVICYTEDDQLIVQIVDSGIGIKDADMHKLFQPFQQVDAGLARLHEGTGLGLSICKRLVDILDGKIWLESEWQVGSTFSFSLPLPTHEPVVKTTNEMVYL